jgi:hypothetical protein
VQYFIISSAFLENIEKSPLKNHADEKKKGWLAGWLVAFLALFFGKLVEFRISLSDR